MKTTISTPLDNFAGEPAFLVDDMIYTPRTKYAVVYGDVRPMHGLAMTGFERALREWCEGGIYTTTRFYCAVQATPEALAMLLRYSCRLQGERDAAAEARRIQDEVYAREQRETVERRINLESFVKSARFTRQNIEASLRRGLVSQAEGDLESARATAMYALGAKALVYSGLAIHKVYAGGKYSITHLESGLRIGMEYASQYDAKVCVVRLAGLCDWTQDAKAVCVAMGPLRTTREALRSDAYARITEVSR